MVSEPVLEKFGTGKKSRNRYRPNLVSEPISEKFGIGKKSRNRYRQNLVPEKSIGIGIVQHFGYRHTLDKVLKIKKIGRFTNTYSTTVLHLSKITFLSATISRVDNPMVLIATFKTVKSEWNRPKLWKMYRSVGDGTQAWLIYVFQQSAFY